ncbi:MAG: ABC transporter substrate-binding protein [Ruminococcaceae bacterium]|nr:ABC transporter substrate-binding protein [Oscillospiraceae bacterium]
MKRIICLLLFLLLCLPTLAACRQTTDTVRVWTLNGTTGFGMAPLIAAADESTYTFTVEKDATAVRDAVINGTADIAALPTNVAAALYNATNGGVRVLALNTGSVLYVVGTDGDIRDLSALSGKTLFVPAQNPTFIMKALLDRAGIPDVVLDSTTYPTPDALRDAVAAGLVTLAVLPEPMLTIAKEAAAREGRALKSLLDVGAEWSNYFNEDSLVQGCVVVRTAFLEEHPEAVAAFLQDYEACIHYVNSYPDLAAAHIKDVGIFANAEVAADALPHCNIIFKSNTDMKSALAAFLAQMPPKAIGGKVPDDDFYYLETK